MAYWGQKSFNGGYRMLSIYIIWSEKALQQSFNNVIDKLKTTNWNATKGNKHISIIKDLNLTTSNLDQIWLNHSTIIRISVYQKWINA